MTSPRLVDPWFEARFYGRCSPDGGTTEYLDSIDGAQGLFLWCPCGYGKPEFPLENGRPHGVMVPFANPRDAPPLPANHGPTSRDDPTRHPRWTMNGTGLSDLTCSPSIAVGKPECWHGYITDGIVRSC